MSTLITVAFGDGVGPEILEAALHILREAGADLEIETIEIGSRIYSMEGASGLLPSAWNSLLRTKILLKGPVIMPEDKNFKSVTDAICDIVEMDGDGLTVHRHSPDIAAAAHIRENFALFEVLQDPSPDAAGKNTADPSGAILAGILLLEHIRQKETASRIREAWRQALAEGLDKALGTREFALAVVERLPIASVSSLLYNPAI